MCTGVAGPESMSTCPSGTVQLFATGLRNSYDFAFDSKGDMFATDNGLGVKGTVPPKDNCDAFVKGGSAIDKWYPGKRDDLIYKVEEGAYYGHPNPSRGECTYFAGSPGSIPNQLVPTDVYGSSFVPPEPKYKLPVWSLGNGKSANGIIAYQSQAFCGVAFDDLMTTYYASDDQVRRLKRNANGEIVDDESVPGTTSFQNPLCIAQDPLGRIAVGQFAGAKVSLLTPKVGAGGCWQEAQLPVAPRAFVDAGSATVGTKIYSFGGKSGSQYFKQTLVYDAWTKKFTDMAPMPIGVSGVENPAVAVDPNTNLIYVVSGSTAPFSNSINKANVYNPATNSWSALPNIPTPVTGAAAVVRSGVLYVIGGMDNSGSNTNSVDLVQTINVNSPTAWSTGPSLPAKIDNAKAAVVDGTIYLFGGRTRGSDNGRTSTYALGSGGGASWVAKAPMPTGRRSACAVVGVSKQIILFGGEYGTGGKVRNDAFKYDPSDNSWASLAPMPQGLHGTSCGKVGNGFYIFGGEGPSGVKKEALVLRYV